MTCARGCCDTQKEHYRSIRIGADRHTPMSNGYTLDFERQEQRDMDAYKRLRQQGLQPPDWTGCASLEKHADTEVEITYGKTLPKQVASAFEVTQ